MHQKQRDQTERQAGLGKPYQQERVEPKGNARSRNSKMLKIRKNVRSIGEKDQP